MPSYPVFSGSPFATNASQLPFNLNQNVNTSLNANPFQQNANMPFLSFPPPSLPGSHHVFQNGPRFPGAVHVMAPAAFATNISGNPSMMPSPGFGANIPVSGNFMPSPASLAGSNIMISPATFTKNSAIATLTSMPPPPSVSPWNPSSIPNTRNFPGQEVQVIPQEFNVRNGNSWASASSNNLQNAASFRPAHAVDAPNPWATDSPTSIGNYNNFQKGSNHKNRTFRDSINPWATDSSSSNYSSNLQYNTEHIKESPSKFRQSKSPACDIDPWVRPTSVSARSSTNGNHFYDRQNHRNFNTNKFNESNSNFNNRRGNTRNSWNHNQNDNYNKRQDRNVKDKGDFKKEFNESKLYSCDTCDRAFSSEGEFQHHNSEHTKCTFKNCQFEAHPKVVALHKKMQHYTGYADAINKLKNSDEIEKWRAERRRRFPTVANILKRKAEQAEKEARGEVVENKDFGKFKRQKSEHRGDTRGNRFNNRNNRRNNNRNRFNAPGITITVTDSDSDDDSHIKLRKFSGVLAVENTNAVETVTKETSNLVENSDDKTEDKIENVVSDNSQYNNEEANIEEETEEKEESNLNINEIETIEDCTKGSGRLNPIDIDSDDDAPIQNPIGKVQSRTDDKEDIEKCKKGSESYNPINIGSDDDAPVEIPIVKVQSSTDDKEDSDDESPIEIPVSKVPLSEISNSTSTKDMPPSPLDTKKDKDAISGKNFSKGETHRRNSNYQKNESHYDNPVRKSTLLEKLLADDIRQERNMIMQVVRHVTKKKFCGIGVQTH